MLQYPPCVILTSYSQRAVTTLLGEFEKLQSPAIEIINCEKWLAQLLGCDNPIQVFMKLGELAFPKIQKAHEQMVRLIQSDRIRELPLLIGATPLLPDQDGWNRIVKNYTPLIIHFDIDADTALKELKQKREADKALLNGNYPNIGMWDKQRITKNSKYGYHLLSDSISSIRIQVELNRLNDSCYRFCKYAVDAWPTLEDINQMWILKNSIATHLGLPITVLHDYAEKLKKVTP